MAQVISPHKPLKIVLISPEAVPFAKTGGLADVAGALPLELARLGHDVRLVIPRYGLIDGARYEFAERMRLSVPTASGPVDAVIEQGTLPDGQSSNDRGIPVFGIRYDPYFDRTGLYQEGGADYPDNLERFSFFCRSAMELLVELQRSSHWTPDLLQAHDWQSALCLVYLRTLYAGHAMAASVRSLFTIHNLGYQGIFPASEYPKLGLGASLFTSGVFE